MPFEFQELAAVDSIPDPGRAIFTSRDDPLPVWGHGDGPDRPDVPFESEEFAGR